MWKPKIFKFSNMFSYGENNIIDFRKIGGIAGLFAANASGKSSILEALSFCLFDKCAKAFKASHVLNNRKEKFSCELNFEIHGEDFFIKKTGTKSKDGSVSVKIDFWKISSDGTKIDLKGEQRRDTSAIISSYIGTYEDFVLTAMSFQNNNTNFIDLGQSERKDLLVQFMDIKIFEELENLASEEVKSYSAILKEFKKRNFDTELVDVENTLLINQKQKITIEIEKNELQVKIKKYNDDVANLSAKLVDTEEYASLDIENLLLARKTIELEISKLNSEVSKFTETISLKIMDYNKLKVEVDGLMMSSIEKSYNEFIKLKDELKNVEDEIKNLEVHVKHKMDKIHKLGELEYDPNCKYCMNNIFVKDAIKTKKEISDDLEMAKQFSENKKILKQKIEDSKAIEEEYNGFNNKQKKLQALKVEALQINSKKSTAEAKISSQEKDLREIELKIETYYKLEDSIKNNKIITTDIFLVKKNIHKESENLQKIEKELIGVSSSILYLEKQKEEIEKDKLDFKEKEEKHASYQYYLEAVKRDAIPYELISKAIPAIESEINNILTQIVDFSILLELDGKNINTKLVYDEDRIWPLEVMSGMERFISGLAIRVALLSISNLPRPNFLAVDEGFSSLDADNSSNLPSLLEYLKTHFDFVFVISHQDYMRDYSDVLLDLKKIDNFSSIQFS